MEQNFLSQSELAKRWGISPRTLERWRWAGEGLRFVKIGGLVRYRLEDVEAYEASNEIPIRGQQRNPQRL
jgi:excisionase family DNA binding protein